MTATPLFRPAENTSAFLKMGLLGFQGSGKTKTAGIVTRGLIKLMRELKLDLGNKPAFFVDTETGSDWLKPDFEGDGIELQVAKTRAFNDLLLAVAEAEKNGSVLIIDSITHHWKELCDSYCAAKAKQFKKTSYRLQFQDWAYLKGQWGKFTDLYVNSSVHIILCGRAGFEYDFQEQDDGTKELHKTGVKMKAEGEMGYEPSLLVMMERHQKVESNQVTHVWREAMVLKDRSTLLDGKSCVDPKFDFFLPHVRCLNLGAKQLGVDTTRTTAHDVSDVRDSSSVQRRIALDEIETLLVETWPSTGKEDKLAKLACIRKHFGDEEIVWTRIEELVPLIELRRAYDSMYRDLRGRPSHYAGLFTPENTTTEQNDSLPDHSAPPAQPSLKDKLIAQLGDQQTMNDVMHFMVEVGGMEGLTDAERNEINKAGLTRQTEISKQAGEQNPQPAEEKPPTSPKPPANKGSRGGKDEAKPEMTEAAQAG